MQNEIITSVVSTTMSSLIDSIVSTETLDESEERGRMTANELELKSDIITQKSDRIRMMDLDLEGYMGRRRELRDRMHNVSR